MVSLVLLAICAVLTFIGAKNTFYIFKILAGIAWWGLGAYWAANPIDVAGSPAQTIALLVVFFAGIACYFWPMWEGKFNRNGQETGGRFRLPFMSTEEDEELSRKQRMLPTRRERQDAYIDRLNALARG